MTVIKHKQEGISAMTVIYKIKKIKNGISVVTVKHKQLVLPCFRFTIQPVVHLFLSHV